MPPWNRVLDSLGKLAEAETGKDFSDSDLLGLFRARGDEAAFTLLVQRHGPMVLGVCRRMVGDAHDAEDAFQASFLVLARKAGSVRKQSSLASWLYGVAYRVACKARARSARRRQHEREAPPPMPTRDTLDELLRHELRAVLDEEVYRLPEKYRRPLVLCCLEGKTHEEAAGELRWPKSSLTARLARARELLRKRLARRGVTAPAGVLAAVLAERTATAAVPAGLTLVTVRLAGQVLAGKVAAAPAAALADSVVKGMTMTKWPSVMVLVLTAGLAAGVGVLAQPRKEAKPAAPAARGVGDDPGEVAGGADREGDPLPAGVLARMGSGRLRHGEALRDLGFSPDGKALVSAGGGRLRVWDVATGKLKGQLPFDSSGVVLAFRAGKPAVLGVGEDRAEPCRLLDLATGKEVKRIRLDAPISRPARAAVSPAGKLIAVGQQPDRVVRLFDADTGKETVRVRPARGVSIFHLAFGPRGKTLALGASGDTVWVHDTGSGKLVEEYKRAGAQFAAMTFSADGRWLTSIWPEAEDGVTVWERATGKLRYRLKGTRWAEACAFSPDGKLLATGGAGVGLRLWDTATGKEVRRLGGPLGGFPSALAFRPDGKALAAVSGEGAITLWDVATGRALAPSAYPVLPVQRLRFSAGGKVLIGQAEVFLAWETSTGRAVRRFPGAGRAEVRRSPAGVPAFLDADEHSHQFLVADLSPDNGLLAGCEADGAISLWDAKAGKKLRVLRGHGKRARVVRFSPDGRRLISGGEMGIRVWDVARGKEVFRLGGLSGFVDVLAVSPEGRWLASCSAFAGPAGGDDSVRLWDLKAGRQVRSFGVRTGAVDALAFAPGGGLLAAVGGNAGSEDEPEPGAIQVWDVRTGKPWRTIEGHKGLVKAIAFSPDGRMLATGGTDRTVRLWELATGRERCRFTGHSSQVDAVAFSPEGRRLAAASAEAPVYVWEVTGGPEEG